MLWIEIESSTDPEVAEVRLGQANIARSIYEDNFSADVIIRQLFSCLDWFPLHRAIHYRVFTLLQDCLVLSKSSILSDSEIMVFVGTQVQQTLSTTCLSYPTDVGTACLDFLVLILLGSNKRALVNLFFDTASPFLMTLDQILSTHLHTIELQRGGCTLILEALQSYDDPDVGKFRCNLPGILLPVIDSMRTHFDDKLIVRTCCKIVLSIYNIAGLDCLQIHADELVAVIIQAISSIIPTHEDKDQDSSIDTISQCLLALENIAFGDHHMTSLVSTPLGFSIFDPLLKMDGNCINLSLILIHRVLNDAFVKSLILFNEENRRDALDHLIQGLDDKVRSIATTSLLDVVVADIENFGGGSNNVTTALSSTTFNNKIQEIGDISQPNNYNIEATNVIHVENLIELVNESQKQAAEAINRADLLASLFKDASKRLQDLLQENEDLRKSCQLPSCESPQYLRFIESPMSFEARECTEVINDYHQNEEICHCRSQDTIENYIQSVPKDSHYNGVSCIASSSIIDCLEKLFTSTSKTCSLYLIQNVSHSVAKAFVTLKSSRSGITSSTFRQFVKSLNLKSDRPCDIDDVLIASNMGVHQQVSISVFAYALVLIAQHHFQYDKAETLLNELSCLLDKSTITMTLESSIYSYDEFNAVALNHHEKLDLAKLYSKFHKEIRDIFQIYSVTEPSKSQANPSFVCGMSLNECMRFMRDFSISPDLVTVTDAKHFFHLSVDGDIQTSRHGEILLQMKQFQNLLTTIAGKCQFFRTNLSSSTPPESCGTISNRLSRLFVWLDRFGPKKIHPTKLRDTKSATKFRIQNLLGTLEEGERSNTRMTQKRDNVRMIHHPFT